MSRLTPIWRFALTTTVLIILAAACGGDDETQAEPTPVTPAPTDAAQPATEFTLVGKNISFDHTSLEVPAGQEITITFDNQDSGIPHNLSVQAGEAGEFKTEIEVGPTADADVHHR